MDTGLNKEERLQLELLRISCESAKIDPLRLVVSVTYLIDLLNAVEKYLYRFDEIMVGAGKAKKEGLDTSGLVEKIQSIQAELYMYFTLAKTKIGKGEN